MKAQYLYHSGVALFGASALVLIDYYPHKNGAAIPAAFALGNLPRYVLISHSHHDHYAKEAAGLPGAVVIASKDVPEPCIKLSPGQCFDDGTLKVQAYGSTDLGISFYMELEGKRIFHAGDLNNWHWQDESEPWYVAQADRDFNRVLDALQADHPDLDAAFFPVDPRMGTDFFKGARQFVEKIRCKTFIPIHFWENFEAANSFEATAAATGSRFVRLKKAGDTFEI